MSIFVWTFETCTEPHETGEYQITAVQADLFAGRCEHG